MLHAFMMCLPQAKLDILQTPDIYIDMRSTAREVQSWLKAKQFSNRCLMTDD